MADAVGSARDSPPTRLGRIGLGALALLFFVIHAFHATRGRSYDILWNCTLSNALIGVGLLAGRSAPVAIGVTWLCLGNLFWLADVLTGGEFFATSTLTHFGGLAVGPRGPYPRVAAAHLALRDARGARPASNCRASSPRQQPTSTLPSRSMPVGSATFPTYRFYWLVMFAETVTVYYLTDRLFRRFFSR